MKRFSIVVLAALVFAGCDSLPFGKADQPQPLPVVAPPPAPLPTLPTAPVAPPPVAAVAPVSVPAYQWTDAPVAATIPMQPAAGLANGRPMGVASVIFEPGQGAWKLTLSDKPLDAPTGLIIGGQSVNIDLPEAPAAGKSWTRKMEYGAGYFQINNDPANPEATTSWNADNAWAIEITAWDVKDYDPAGPLFQEAGKASGKIAVCYKGDGAAFQNSWIAGTFTDAVVRYMGKPYWLETGAAATTGSTGSTGSAKEKLEKAKEGVTTPEPTPEPEPEPKGEPAKPGVDPEKVKKTIIDGINKLKEKKAQQ